MSDRRAGVVVGVIALVVLIWMTGALDRPLSEVGLNRRACVVNGFGAKFCGDDAVSYCKNIRSFAPSAACDEVIKEAK